MFHPAGGMLRNLSCWTETLRSIAREGRRYWRSDNWSRTKCIDLAIITYCIIVSNWLPILLLSDFQRNVFHLNSCLHRFLVPHNAPRNEDKFRENQSETKKRRNKIQETALRWNTVHNQISLDDVKKIIKNLYLYENLHIGVPKVMDQSEIGDRIAHFQSK